MLEIPSAELATIIVSSIGGIVTISTLIWKKFLKPLVKLCQNQEFFKESVEEIKKELTTNGGSSLKDAIIDMKDTVHRIDKRQKNNRTKD